ncbi:MAG: hypothetical protein AB1435_11590 [Chloroflexota bacterium]|jgi:hypothetical protein
MATNASTWFYSEPEHKAYLIEERVNHTFWSNRITSLHLACTHIEPPFRMEGEWRSIPLALEWVPGDYLTLTTRSAEDITPLLVGIKEILGFAPTISYVDPEGNRVAQWYATDVEGRIQNIQGNPNFRQIKRYK